MQELVALAEGQTHVRGRNGACGRCTAIASMCWSASRSRSPDEPADSVLVTLTDITLQKLAEQARRDSEALFHEMADTAPAMLWISDRVRRMDVPEPAMVRAHRSGAGERARPRLVGRRCIPTIATAPPTRCSKPRDQRRPFHFECRLSQPDEGEPRWTIIAGQPRFGGDGEFLGFVGSAIDITERRKAEEAVIDEVHTRETLSRVGAALASELDPETLIQSAIDAATALTSAQWGVFFFTVVDDSGNTHEHHAVSGLPKDAFAGAPDESPTGGIAVQRSCASTICSSWRVCRREARSIADGCRRISGAQLSVRARRVANRRGARRRVLRPHPCRCLSAQARAAGERDRGVGGARARQRQPLQGSAGSQPREGRVHRDAVARAAHAAERDARAGRICCARTCCRPTRSGARSKRSSATSARRRSSSTTCSTSRASSPASCTSRADEVDLAAVVTSAADTVRPAAVAKGLTFRVVVDRRAAGHRHGRCRPAAADSLEPADQRGQVHAQGRPGRRSSCATTDTSASVVVTDTGQGIRHDFLQHVFERFRQADSTASRTAWRAGAGSGDRAASHRSAWRLRVRRECGRGSRRDVHRPPAGSRSARASTTAVRARSREGTALAGLRVLLVDDEADTREVLRDAARSAGRECDGGLVCRRGARPAADGIRPTSCSRTSACRSRTGTR